MDDWRVEQLNDTHERKSFDCGKPSLDDFIKSLVSQYEKRNLGRTYVAVAPNQKRIVGYYTLASCAIDTRSLPAKQSKKLPRHPVPVVLIARLAVDRSLHGKGLGALLLKDALTRSLDISERLGIHAVVVDAIDAQAKGLYQRFGFLELADNPMRLFLPIATIRAATAKT